MFGTNVVILSIIQIQDYVIQDRKRQNGLSDQNICHLTHLTVLFLGKKRYEHKYLLIV